MSTIEERLAILIDARTKDAVRNLDQAGDASARLGEKTSRSQQVMQKFGLSGVSTGQMLKAGLTVGAVAGGVALAKFALDGANRFVDLAVRVREVQRATGATAEEASKLVNIGARLGVETTTLSTAFGKLGKDIAGGKDKLADYGIAVQKNRDGTTNMIGTLAAVGEKYRAMQDPAARNTMLLDLFGKAGLRLNPILSQSKEALQQFIDQAQRNHQILGQGDVDKAFEYRQAVKELSQAWSGLSEELGSAIIPLLSDVTHILTAGVGVLDTVIHAWEGLPGPVKTAAEAMVAFKIASMVFRTDFVQGIGAGIKGAVSGFGEFGAAVRSADATFGRTTSRTKMLAGGIGAVGSSFLTAVAPAAALGVGMGLLSYQMDRNAEQARKNDEAQTKLANGLLAGGAAADKAQRQMDGMRDMIAKLKKTSSEGTTVGKALFGDSEGFLAEKLQGQLDGVKKKLKEKADEETLAGQATDKANTAQATYIDLVMKGQAGSKKAQEQLAIYRSETDKTKAAQDAFTTATKTEVQAQKDAADAINAVIQARRNLQNLDLGALGAMNTYTDAVKANRDANFGVVLATNALQDARSKGDPKAIAAAEAELTAAQLRQRDAGLALAQAAVGLDQSQTDLEASVRANVPAAYAQLATLEELKKNYPEAAGSIQPMIDKLQGVIDKVSGVHSPPTVTIVVDSAEAEAKLQALKLHILSLVPGSDPAWADALARNMPTGTGRRIGGPIPGPRDSPQPILAHGGEYVLSADVVDRIKKGRPMLGAKTNVGLGASGGGSVTVNINAPVYGVDDLEAAIAAGVKQGHRELVTAIRGV